MAKRFISIVLVVALTFTMSGLTYAQDNDAEDLFVENGLMDYEIHEIAEELEKIDTENELLDDICSIEEIEEYVEATDGIEYTEIEEETISAEEAIGEIFNNNEISELEVSQTEIAECDDIKYVIEVYEEENITYVKTYSEDMQQMALLSYDGVTVTSENYVYNVEKGGFEKQYIELICEDEANTTNDVYAQAITYNSKTKSAKWKDTIYWYQTGKDGEKTYLKIGCKATYRIRTDNLSSTKDKKCDKYISAVKSSKSYENKALAYASGTGITGSAVIAIALANATLPPTALISVVSLTLGGGATIYKAVTYAIDSYEKWQDARDYYNTIKAYGTKL